MIAKTQFLLPTHVVLTLSVGLLVAFVSPLAAAPANIVSRENPVPDVPSSTAVPLDQLGAVAGKAYQGEGLSVSATGEGARLHCDFQRLEGEATPRGLWLRSTANHGDTDRFRVTASGLGRDFLKRLPVAGEVAVAGQTVRFIRSELVEEYSVSMDGIRQDFILEQRPVGAGELRVELDVTGATAEALANGARLTLQASGRKLAYNRLHVTDATGRELPARMEMTGNEYDFSDGPPRLCVKVDDANAVYPLRIDPTFSDANWISMGGYAGTYGYGGFSGSAISGFVYAAAFDSSGNLYIGGEFGIVGELLASNIAKWDGSNWSTLGSGLNGSVRALAVSVTNLYAGGNFTTAGGVAASCVAKWNGLSWSALGSGIPTNAPSVPAVCALAVSGTDLYVGGKFTTVGGISANSIAKWNGTTWSALGAGMGNGAPTPIVRALAVSGSTLYVGGEFNVPQGAPGNAVAKWNGSSWSALGSGVGGRVYALAVSGSDLIAGGSFDYAGAVDVNNIAKWNGSSWSELAAFTGIGSGVDYYTTVNSLAVSGSDLYVGGRFKQGYSNGQGSSILKWNGSSFSALSSGVAGGSGEFAGTILPIVNALAIFGTNVYAGGDFTRAGGTTAMNIAQWNGTNWSSLGLGGFNGPVDAFAVLSNDLYVGGSFTLIGSTVAKGVARWTGSGWSALGSGIENGSVYALAVSGTNLYAGGGFGMAGGMMANFIAKWDGSNWSALGSGTDGGITAVAVLGTNLYVGGWFGIAGGVSAEGIARWNGSSWSALGGGLYYVMTLAVSGNDLYVGGYFSSDSGAVGNGIVKWNGSSWSTLGSGTDSGVSAVAVSGNDVYAGGYFTTAGGVPANHIAKWNGSSWSALGDGFTKNVTALAFSGTDLYVGGDTYVTSDQTQTYVAKWNGSSWSTLGSGVNSGVSEVAVLGNKLFVGGYFSTAGGKVSAYLAEALLPVSEGRFENGTFSPINGFNCTFTDGTVGQPYRIQTSPNVAAGPWTDFTNFTYTAPRVITDATAVSGTNRFFRAVSP